MKKHAILAASAAHRWVNCTASYQMTKDLPDTVSVHAQRGSYLHELAYKLLTNECDKLTFADCNELEAYAVQSYVDYIRALDAEHYLLEVEVNFSHIVPEGFGTSDAIIINQDKMTIVDFKAGQGVPVFAKENEQLMLYALGAINTFRDETLLVNKIELVIHQAIINNVNSWTLTIDELNIYAQKFKTAALETLDLTQHRFTPSESVCKFCRAKGNCKAYADYATDMVVKGFDNLSLNPYRLSDDEIVNVLNKADAFLDWVEAVKHLAKDKLLRNEHLQGFYLAMGRKTRSWSDEKALEQYLRTKRVPLSLYKPRKLATVAQLEKLIKNMKNRNIDLNEFIAVSSGAPRIVKDCSNTKTYQDYVLDGFKNENVA